MLALSDAYDPLERHQGRPPDVLHPNEHPRSARVLERLLLGLDGVRSVTIAERPSPHVEALYVEVRPGRSEGRTIQQVRAAAWDKARVDIHPAQADLSLLALGSLWVLPVAGGIPRLRRRRFRPGCFAWEMS
jgi:hypothetical protein